MSIELNCRNYQALLRKCIESYHFTPCPRDQRTFELIHNTTEWDMNFPVITIISRKLNYNFMFAEAYWILMGSAMLSGVDSHCGSIQKYSDDLITMSGAYGPQFIQQYRYVVDMLRQDKQTRQALMTFWRPSPRESKDIPCTVSLQFLVRNNEIHTSVYMRSSDVWLGLPYDIFCFSMITEYIRLALGNADIRLGKLRMTAGSQHLYQRDEHPAWLLTNDHTPCGVYQPMSSHGFNHPVELLEWLGMQRNHPKYVISQN